MQTNLFDLEGYAHRQLFTELQYPWDALKRLKDYLLQFQGKQVNMKEYPGVHFKHPESIFVGKNVEIEPGAFIQGPCFLGDESCVRHGAYIRGMVITGNKCVIGHGSEIKGSILLNQVSVPHFNYVGDSILGNRVNLGAGVKCANVRLDGKEVLVLWSNKKMGSGLKKLGALIGDGSQLGCNCVTSPGTIILPSVCCFPLKHLRGVIEKDVTE